MGGLDMKGHLSIIEMRKAGEKPGFIFINDYPCRTDWEKYGECPTVEISPKDEPQWIDLRFLVGAKVAVAGHDEKRLKRLFEACKKSGAVTVAACVVDKSVGNLYGLASYKPGWSEIWHKD
jgi:hypothetical protein